MNMGSIGAGFSMSLDGFIAGPGDDIMRLFSWMFSGDTDVKINIGEEEMDLKVSSEDAERWEAPEMGAIVSGRRMFDVAEAWGGKHPMNVPVVVLTHTVPQEWVKEGSPFTFVTEGGIEAAVEQARKIAGNKGIGVGGADITRQCLKAGLLDEIGIDLVPVLLGSGVRLFEHLGIEPIELECTSMTQAPGVTHMRFRVIK